MKRQASRQEVRTVQVDSERSRMRASGYRDLDVVVDTENRDGSLCGKFNLFDLAHGRLHDASCLVVTHDSADQIQSVPGARKIMRKT